MNLQAVHQFHAMVFDGLGADLQNFGNAFGVLASGDELEYLALTPCQLVKRTFSISDRFQGEFFEELRGDFLTQINFLVNHTLQDRLNLLGSRLGPLGSDFSLFCARLRQFCPGFSLFCARLRRFRPGLGLLGSRLGLLSSGFGLLSSRLITGRARLLIIFFHFAPTLSRETSRAPWGIYPMPGFMRIQAFFRTGGGGAVKRGTESCAPTLTV